jgi:ATP/maltotriose-dependent transcriptional regulator MalT
MELDGIEAHAEEAIQQPDLSGQDRCNALYLLAEEQLHRGDHAQAATAIREVTQLRRHSADWVLLAECERALGNNAAADAGL